MEKPLRSLGVLQATKSALTTVGQEEINQALISFQQCHWGKVTLLEWQQNEEALQNQTSVRGLYRDKKGNWFTVYTNDSQTKTYIRLKKKETKKEETKRKSKSKTK